MKLALLCHSKSIHINVLKPKEMAPPTQQDKTETSDQRFCVVQSTHIWLVRKKIKNIHHAMRIV